MAERDLEIALLIRSEVDRAVNDLRRFNSETRRNITETQRTAERASATFSSFRGLLGALGVGFSVGSIISGIRAIGREAMEAERIEGRLNAVLEATGRSAALSAEQIQLFADRLQETTRFTDDEVKAAATTLATFTNVANQNFERALQMAAGLASVMETDLRSAAQQLGRVLNDPVRQLSALSRAGITFTETQQRMITEMVRTGQVARAQQVILDELARRGLGGAAAGENTGLFKATNDVAKAWSDMLEAIGRTPTVQSGATATLGLIAQALRLVEQQAKNARSEIRDLVEPPPPRRLDGGVQQFPGFPGLAGRSTAEIRAAQADIDQQLRATREIREETRKLLEDFDRRIALLGKEKAEEQLLYELEQGRYKHLNQAERELLLSRARQLDALQAEQQFLKDDEAAIDAAIEAKYRWKRAQEEAAEAVRDAIEPTREIQREINALFELYERGFITQDEFEERFIQLTDQLREARGELAELEDQSKVFADQMRRNLQTAFADEIFNLITGRFDSIGEAFSNLLARMAAELAASQILTFLTDMFPALRGTMNPGELLARDILAAVNHRGGIVGRDGARRRVPAAAFLGAPRLHAGGIAGLAPDEVPTILQRGELVIPRDAVRAGAAGPFKVEIENRGAAPIEAREASFDPESMTLRIIVDDVRRGGPISETLARTFNLRRRG